MKTVDGNYVVCGFSRKICYTEREAGLVFFMTHLALYDMDSKDYAWEDVFYKDYERTQKRQCV